MIVRHCHEKLPGGLATWKRLCRLAGYRGEVHVMGYGLSALHDIRLIRATHAITRGYTQSINGHVLRIVVFLDHKHAPCSKWLLKDDPLFTLAHELGHAWAIRHGRKMRTSAGATYGQWARMKQEQRADRYARRLLRRAGLR